MAGPVLKETVKKGIDLTKPAVSNILKTATEIVTKAKGKPKKIEESTIVKDQVFETTEGASQAEGGNIVSGEGTGVPNKKNYLIKPTPKEEEVILDLVKPMSRFTKHEK